MHTKSFVLLLLVALPAACLAPAPAPQTAPVVQTVLVPETVIVPQVTVVIAQVPIVETVVVPETVIVTANTEPETQPPQTAPAQTLTGTAAPTNLPLAQLAPATPLPADKGCYLFHSYVGGDLTCTFTLQEHHWNLTFTLPGMGEYLLCLEPGHYTYTINNYQLGIDNDRLGLNGEITAVAGEYKRIPVAVR